MRKIIERLFGLRELCEKTQIDLAKKLNIMESDSPASLFGMAFNKVTFCIESMDLYDNAWRTWKRPLGCQIPDEQIRKENGERIILLQRALFVEMLSSIEFVFKLSFLNSPSLFDERDKELYTRTANPERLYLRGIIKKSHQKGLINKEDKDLWNGLINFRNSIVHNNAITEITKNYIFPTFELKLEKDKMHQGDLNTFINMIEWMIIKSKEWVDNTLLPKQLPH